MLLLILGWIALAVCVAPVGAAVLCALDADAIGRDALQQDAPGQDVRGQDVREQDPLDFYILAIWFGLMVLGCALLGLALVLPLGSASALIPVLAGAAALASRRTRDSLRRKVPLPVAFAAALVFLALAYHASSVQVDAYDTGLYHQQAISWLSLFGTVKGLAWLHFRLGWPSSWFALCAALNHGIGVGRTSALVGGFAVLLVCVHWVSKLYRFIAGTLRPAGAYVLATYPIAVAAAWYWHFDLSSGTDIPGWVLTLLVGWTTLLVAGPPARTTAGLIPFALASLALACKLTVLPLLPATFLFALVETRKHRFTKRWLLIAACGAIPPAVLIASNIVVSGCPLYPSPVACLATGWSIPKDMAQYVTDDIRTACRWLGIPETEQHGYRWLLYWVKQKEKLAAVLMTAVSTIIVVFRARNQRHRRLLWIVAFGSLGLLTVAVNAPNLRYGLGFFLLFPGALAASLWPVERPRILAARGPSTPAFACLAVLLILVVAMVVEDPRRRMPASGNIWLHPPALPSREGEMSHIYNRYENRTVPLHFLWRHVNDISFRLTFPVDQCWNLPVPCTPFVLNENFALRDPSRGLSGGFRSVPAPRHDRYGPHVAQ